MNGIQVSIIKRVILLEVDPPAPGVGCSSSSDHDSGGGDSGGSVVRAVEVAAAVNANDEKTKNCIPH